MYKRFWVKKWLDLGGGGWYILMCFLSSLLVGFENGKICNMLISSELMMFECLCSGIFDGDGVCH